MSYFQKGIAVFLIVVAGGGTVILSYVGIPSPMAEIRKVIPTPSPVN